MRGLATGGGQPCGGEITSLRTTSLTQCGNTAMNQNPEEGGRVSVWSTDDWSSLWWARNEG